MARSLGKVDLLGLNQFGQNPGLNPIWGTLIGGVTAGGTTVALRYSNSKAGQYPEAIGLAAGLAATGALYAMKSTRHAALGALVGTFLASGIAWLEKMLTGAQTVSAPVAAAGAAVAAGTAGMGIPDIRALNGLGIPQARMLNGLGMPNISQTPHAQGTIPGVAGNQISGPGGSNPPVSLLGNMSPQAAHLRGIGGPSVHGLSAAYGATLLGGGR